VVVVQRYLYVTKVDIGKPKRWSLYTSGRYSVVVVNPGLTVSFFLNFLLLMMSDTEFMILVNIMYNLEAYDNI